MVNHLRRHFNFFLIKNIVFYFLEFCLNVGKFLGTFLDSFGHICIVAKSPLSLPSFMCLSVCISMPSIGQVFVKFDTGDFYENL